MINVVNIKSKRMKGYNDFDVYDITRAYFECIRRIDVCNGYIKKQTNNLSMLSDGLKKPLFQDEILERKIKKEIAKTKDILASVKIILNESISEKEILEEKFELSVGMDINDYLIV